ncbi:MAG TPA: sulfatase [Candidatus Brocadiia bacterium]|nr:sulfatase [Candidatus Brocadiia bacterium]
MNVIVIVTDSLRADHVGCYGSTVKTPNIDKLASESAVFDNAYSENLPTLPCRTAWWTGKYLFTRRGWQHFEPTDYLLAEVLWDKGVTSALVTDVYHMHKPVYNCGRGYDSVFFIRGQEYDPWILDPKITVDLDRRHRLRGDDSDQLWKPRFEQYLRNVSGFKSEEDYFVAQVVKSAIRWLDYITRKAKDDLFLWVDCFDPHEPWDPPSPYREMYDPDYSGPDLIDPVPGPVAGYMTDRELRHTKALYAGEVTFVDKWVGVLLDRIRELGLFENTMIVFTSDHGEPFGEHGIIRKARPWGYEELAHVPLIIHHPAGEGAGRRFPGFVQPPDLMPTILDAMGIKSELVLSYTAPVKHAFPQDIVIDSKGVTPDGLSLIPMLRGDVSSIRDYAITAHCNAQWALRTADWTYLHEVRGDRPCELYDRRTDRAEQTNLIGGNTDVADALELKLRRLAGAMQ